VTDNVIQTQKRTADSTALKMKEEMKVLDAEEIEQVTGGTIDWRHFPKEVRDAIEKEQQKDGGATSSW